MPLHRISFKHAADGLLYFFRTQPNFRFHTYAATAVILASLWLRVNYLEWIILLFTIMLVLVAEMVNTAIESMTDLITLEYRAQAKVAKDVSAGMVLGTAILSVVVGVTVFLPYLLHLVLPS